MMLTEQKIKNVPFFNYQYFYLHHRAPLLAITEDVLKRGAFIMQQDLKDFEQAIANYLGVKHAIGVANCTDGLQLALQACGITHGDEVVVPAHTFIATAAAVITCGAKPIPVDIGPDHLINVDLIEKAITNKTKAIMPVQLNGRTCNMNVIIAIAKQHNLLIIEDAAQALGSKYKGHAAGTFGCAAAFSFYPAKVLGCLGDGGMVVTNDDEVAAKLYGLHDHGRNPQGEMTMWGVNSRLDNLQAAYLNYFLKQYDRAVAHRRDLAARYDENLKHLSELKLPPAPHSNPDHFDVYQNYEIEAAQRDALQTYLKERGVGTIIQWGGQLIHQFEHLGLEANTPDAQKMIGKSLLLPMSLALSLEDVDYICEQITAFYVK